MKRLPYILPIIILIQWHCTGNTYKEGKYLYEKLCASCHMNNGEGLGEAIPSLKTMDLIAIKDQLPCLIRHGKEGKMMIMPAHKTLTSAEISNIIHYVINDLGQNDLQISIQQIDAQLRNCP